MAGGLPQTLATWSSDIPGASWGEDDRIVYTSVRSLMQVPAAGGEPTTVFADNVRWSRYPQVLPGGGAVLFTLSDPDELHLLILETGEHRTLVPTASGGRVLATGHLVFVRGGSLWAVPFDPDRLDIVGNPAPVLEGVRVEATGAANYTVADDGTLVYLSGDVAAAGESTLVLVDRQGSVDGARWHCSPSGGLGSGP